MNITAPASRGRILWWGLTRRCPRCGSGRLFRRWFHIERACPRCGLVFEREPGYWIGAMAINIALTTGVLAVAFIVAIAVAIYSLVAEKQIAIEFARKELVGVRYIESLRDVYAALLSDPLAHTSSAPFANATLKSLADAEAASGGTLQTGALEESLTTTLRTLWSGTVKGDAQKSLVAEALGKTRDLISRIGDDSNLALDPDLIRQAKADFAGGR